jgi:hypothetical protein
MIELKPQDKWPPLVGANNVPALILVRDAALTWFAWIMLAYLMRDLIELAWDYLRYPIFELTASSARDWHMLWRELQTYTRRFQGPSAKRSA